MSPLSYSQLNLLINVPLVNSPPLLFDILLPYFLTTLNLSEELSLLDVIFKTSSRRFVTPDGYPPRLMDYG